MVGVNQEIRGVALGPGERVLDKAQATLGLLGGGDLYVTSQRLIWVGALQFLPSTPSWFVPGWRVVVALPSVDGIYDQGCVLLVVEATGAHYEFRLRRWCISQRRRAQQGTEAGDEELRG